MDINALLAAFGGGVMGALLGGLPCFVMTGLIVIAGTIASLAGDASAFAGVAFGSFFGPHVAFCGGAAATAYAARKGLIENGQSLDSTMGTGAADPLIVGGVFGILGYLINFLYSNVLGLPTDTIAMTVVTSGIIARLVFGKTGVFGKYDSGEKRVFLTPGKGLILNLVVGLGIGILVAFLPSALQAAGASADWISGNFQNLMFGIAAFSLVFASMGKASPGFHHIIAPAAGASVMLGPVWGIVFGVVGSLLGDLLGNLYNNGKCDSHIDPPGGAIFIQMFIILALAG
ncbi:MAG: hypothetical protein Q4B42_00340 [Oscillospiraceae bacterium]|nr:hypothetical protein [Oscillospiraceae bacterium]